MSQKKSRKLKQSKQRSVSSVEGLIPISMNSIPGMDERASKRQRKMSSKLLVEIEKAANEQNAKARRTETRRKQTDCPPLESVLSAQSSTAPNRKGKKRAEKKSEEMVDDEKKDVHEILLGKSESIPLDLPESEANKKPISVEESDARETYNAMSGKIRRDRESISLFEEATVAGNSMLPRANILPPGKTRPWIETLQMLYASRAKDLPVDIFTEQNEREPPSTSSIASAPKAKSSRQQHTQEESLKQVWLADPAAITMYIHKLQNHADANTSESLRRALKRPELTNNQDPHLCTREHVDRVLCCPFGPFRACPMGNMCIAKKMYSALPGPLMEYVSPSQYEQIVRGNDTRTLGETEFCYICLLCFYNREHHYAREKGPSVVGVRPQFYHVVGPGEYHHRSMIESLTGAEDTPADKPMVNCSVAGFENCGGLVTSLRKLTRQDYEVVTGKRVTVETADGDSETFTIFGLQETDPAFVKHATTKEDPDFLDPYIRLRHLIVHRPDMWEIMQYYFSTHNRIPSIGISRLRNAHPQVKKEVLVLAVYWGITSPVSHASAFASRLDRSGFEPFPFHYVFCEDLSKTAEHLEAVLRGGRIHLSYLRGQEDYREVMNHPIDADTPLRVYSDALRDHPFFSTRRLLAAYLVRQQVLATLLSMYPSNTAYNDASIHKRLTIMHSWNQNQYGYLTEQEEGDESLRKVEPLPFYFFASDIDFYKVRTEIVLKRSPRECLIDHFGERLFFLEFKEMRRALRDRKIDREEALSLWKQATSGTKQYFEHPCVPEELTDEATPSYIKYDLLCDQYAVLWCLMVRLNCTHQIVVREEERLERLATDLRNIEEKFLGQPSPKKVEEALSAASSENNRRTATRLRSTITNNFVTREKVEKCRVAHVRQQELVYQAYCFLYTHLALAERSVDLRLLRDADFYQPSPVVPSAEEVSLNREMQQYQGRPFSICERPEKRLASLLTYLRPRKPKFVARVVNAFDYLYVHPATGFVMTHDYETFRRPTCFSNTTVHTYDQETVVNPDFIAALGQDTRPYYQVGEVEPFNLVYTDLTMLEVRVDNRTGRVQVVYWFGGHRQERRKKALNLTGMFVRDPGYSMRLAEALEARHRRTLELENGERDEDEGFEELSFCIAGNGRTLSEATAEKKQISTPYANKYEYASYENYPPFPINPELVDKFAHKIEYLQEDLNSYFEKFLDPLVTCLNEVCHARERQHLAQFYIELHIDEDGLVRRDEYNYGKIRQVSTKRQFGFLKELLSDSKNQMITHYTECYPDDRKTVHEGMLPNLSPIIGCINFVDDNSAEPKSNTRKPPAIIYTLRKLYPKCCQSRKKNEKHIGACKDNISYLMLVRECFLVTMLGSYRHATKRPKFLKALGVFKLMRSHFNVERFLEEQKRFPSLFTFCMTEALMVWTRSTYAYYQYVLTRYPIYVRFESTVFIKADRIREDFGEGKSITQIDGFIDERELFASEPSSSQTKNHVYRRTCFNPIFKLRAFVTEILNKPNYKNRPEMPKILQKAIRRRVYSLPSNSDIDMIAILGEFNQFHPPDVEPMVHELNIQPCTEVILYWVLRLMANAAPEDSIRELLELMPPKDMEVFDLFINTLARHYSINIFKLPEFMRAQQELALKLRSEIHNPTVASGSLVITTCCNQKKTYDSRENSKSAHHHYGSRLMSLDMRDGYEIFCCSKKDADIERKHNRMRKDKQKELERARITGKTDSEIAKIVDARAPDWKAYATYRNQPKCGETPAQLYSLIGNVVQISDTRGIVNAFTICVNCGSPCGFSRRMYDVNWFSCMTCEMEHVTKMRTPRCVACRHFLKFSKKGDADWKRFHVFNDNQVPVSYTFDTFYVCDRCYGTKTSYFRADNIYTTTELKNAKYAHEQRAVFDLREWAIDVRQVINYYHSHHEIRLSHPETHESENLWDDDEDDEPRRSTRQEWRVQQAGPNRPYDVNSNYYGNFRTIDMHHGDCSNFSNFFHALDGAIFPSSLTDAETFHIQNQLPVDD